MTKDAKNGDYFIKACQMVSENPTFVFCYAKVLGQGPLTGIRFHHAWVELRDVVFDYSNGNNIVLRKELYYEKANIEEQDVVKQTSNEVILLMLQTGTYGGWIK